jgi:hypothetical protein
MMPAQGVHFKFAGRDFESSIQIAINQMPQLIHGFACSLLLFLSYFFLRKKVTKKPPENDISPTLRSGLAAARFRGQLCSAVVQGRLSFSAMVLMLDVYNKGDFVLLCA